MKSEPLVQSISEPLLSLSQIALVVIIKIHLQHYTLSRAHKVNLTAEGKRKRTRASKQAKKQGTGLYC
jgi:hypothetical protein